MEGDQRGETFADRIGFTGTEGDDVASFDGEKDELTGPEKCGEHGWIALPIPFDGLQGTIRASQRDKVFLLDGENLRIALRSGLFAKLSAMFADQFG